MRRYLAAREAGGTDASLGGAVELRGHVRLWNGLSAGASAGWEWSPASPAMRHLFRFGARLRWVPVPSARSTQWWVFGGLGCALAYSPSFDTTLPAIINGSPRLTTVSVDSASGSFFEVPFGFGVGSAPRPRRLQLHAELVATIGFGHRGTLYDLDLGRNASAVGSKIPLSVSNPGSDAFGLGLLVGVNWGL